MPAMAHTRPNSIPVAERRDSRGYCGNDIVISAPKRIARTIPSVPIVVIPVFAGLEGFLDIVHTRDRPRTSNEPCGQERKRHQ